MKYPFLKNIVFLLLMPLSVKAQNEISTSLFTGKLNYTIPVYTIEDPDLHLDIVLRYNSDGFKPFQPSGCYGQNWTLIAGGYITREVQDIADEHKMIYDDCCDREIGMLRAIKEGKMPDKDEVFDFTSDYYKPRCGVRYDTLDYYPEGYTFPDCYGWCGWKRDYMPDIYRFSFCGHEGSFTINNIGNPLIISGDFVDIDLSNFGVANTNLNATDSYYFPQDSSSITIRTTDGYSYIFGGIPEAMEYSTVVFRNRSRDQQIPAINTWHITKVIAPNGRFISFNYIKEGTNLRSFITDLDWTGRQIWEHSLNYTEGDSTNLTYSLHKECLLESIITSDETPLTIVFFSRLESFPMYEHTEFSYCKPLLQLDSILVKYNEDTLRTIKLSYQYRSTSMQFGANPNYHWKYLKQVAVSGKGKYQMTYADTIPESGNPHFPLYLFHYPQLFPLNDAEYKSIVDRFGYWKISPLQGMLSEVILPTGGIQRFSYGTHQYAEERRFCVMAVSDNDVQLRQISNPDTAIGGARIEKIETFSDAATIVDTKTFSYKNSVTGKSTGIFYNIFEVYNDVANQVHMVLRPYNYGMITSHIGYSSVEQTTILGTNQSRTAYSFDSGLRSAWYTSYYNSSVNRDITAREAIHIPDSNFYDKSEVFTGDLTYDGVLIPPGKLIKTEFFEGESSTPVKSVQYTYNNGATTTMHQYGQPPSTINLFGCVDTIVCLSALREDYDGYKRDVTGVDYRPANVARKLLVCPDVLEKVTTREYADGLMMETVQNYTYDRKLRKKEITTIDTHGMQHFTKYTYPDDVPGADHFGGFPSPLFNMIHSMRIGIPVETLSGYIDGNFEYITSGNINLYSQNTYIIPLDWDLPYTVQGLGFRPYLYQTLSLSLSEPLRSDGYHPMQVANGQLIYDPHYKSTCEYQFDIKDRPTSIKPAGQAATKYTWNGIYPATKTIGNQTWTYTHKPYVGITSMTDPRGITTYYKYDSAGRPIEEYQMVNGRKYILKAYQYHIKTE